MPIHTARVALLLLGLRLVRDAAAASCIASPSQPSCSAYTYPANRTSTELSTLCAHTPSLPACSVRRQCEAHGGGSACAPFSLLADVCTQMASNSVCTSGYGSLCAPDSLVTECVSLPPLPRLPTMDQAETSARSICHQMPGMSACSSCSSAASGCPDPLLSLSMLCLAMPGMDACASWRAFCAVEATARALPTLCGKSRPDPDVPAMRMYFHTGIHEYLLLQSWVPRTNTAYALSCACVAALGAFLVWLRGARVLLELRLHKLGAHARTSKYAANAQRGAMAVVISALDYALMLLAMTFNVGLVASILGGVGAGHLLFGHVGKARPAAAVAAADGAVRPHGADGPGAGLTEGGAGGDVGGGGEAARIDSLQEPFLMQRVQLSPEDGCCQ